MVEWQAHFCRDMREMCLEMSFLAMWTYPTAVEFGRPETVGCALKSEPEPRARLEVNAALARVSAGRFVGDNPRARMDGPWPWFQCVVISWNARRGF